MLNNFCLVLVLTHSVRISAEHYTRSPLSSLSLEGTNDNYNEDREMLKMLRGRPANELPELKSSFIEDDTALLRASELILDHPDSMHRKCTISEFLVLEFATIAQSVSYSWMFSHLYDSYNDMRLAAGASVNNEQCIRQLEHLLARAEQLANDKYNSTDINFYQLMDTWGHMPSGQMLGNLFMEGMYKECSRLKIELPDGSQAPTRYCSLSLKLKNWPKIDRHNVLGLQAGICIPRACDSSNYKNKMELLMILLQHQMRRLDEGQFAASHLYCLPDEDSPSRSIWASPRATATVVFLASWLALLVYCTYRHHKLISPASLKDSKINETIAKDEQQSAHAKMCEMLSIKRNLIRLFSTGKASSLIDGNMKESAEKDVSDKQETQTNIVDFGCVDGIKVISMVYIILGHVLMCLPTIMLNGRELSGSTSIPVFLANLLPAFAVNSFFTITGTLTCYMTLKQNQAHKFISNPVKWLALFLYRYLRIMPIYALVVLYCKTLAKYTNSGPLWDYATSSLSQRRTCEQESWATTLLFRSNYENPLTLCIPGGWYLANDFQFFLVTPIFLMLLHKKPSVGQALLLLCTAAGHLASVLSIFSTSLSDMRPIASFSPHGFKTYVSHFSETYTRPSYRIPAYLIGLLVGYQLYRYEMAKIEFRASAERWQQQQQAEAKLGWTAQEAPPELQGADWPWYCKKFAIPISVFGIAFCLTTPLLSLVIPITKWTALFCFATITPSCHVVFSLAIGSYLLIASTDSTTALNNFLSSDFWKPLARLSLCALLVNVEVINYIVQGSSNMYYLSSQFHAALDCLCILATYLVSIVVCVLFEAPMRAALNSLLAHTIKRLSTQVKKPPRQVCRLESKLDRYQ